MFIYYYLQDFADFALALFLQDLAPQLDEDLQLRAVFEQPFEPHDLVEHDFVLFAFEDVDFAVLLQLEHDFVFLQDFVDDLPLF